MTSTGSQPIAGRVLIVDDDARVRAGLRALIDASPGHVVVGEAATPVDALTQVPAARPGLVLCDLLLPTARDGLRLVHALAAQGVAVVAMSVRSGLRQPALTAGARAFVDKGTTPEALLAALDGHHQPRQDAS